MTKNNYYALEATLSVGPTSSELEPESVRAWLADIQGLSLQQAIPPLIANLDGMSRVTMPATTRWNILRALKRPVLMAAAGLPKPLRVAPHRGPDDSDPLSLEQRLYCLMAKNLKQVLQDLDHSSDAFHTDVTQHRRWAVRNLMRFLGRQIELSLLVGRSPPHHTWHELHDLYLYLSARSGARPEGTGLSAEYANRFDPEREYKRLLLLGCAHRLIQHLSWGTFVSDDLESWVQDTRLESPEAFVGKIGLFVVDTSRDTPPRQIQHMLTKPFLGWVLLPASGFLKHIAALQREALFRASKPAIGKTRVAG